MNDQLIFSDGKTLYITLESNIKTWVKVLLILVNVVLYSLPIVLLSFFSADESKEAYLGMIIFAGAIFFFVTRPTLWNIFGRERIVITKYQLSYSRDYGLYKTPVNNVKLEHGLVAYVEDELTYTDDPYVVMSFCEYLPNDDYRLIITTGIKTPEENYKTILKELNEIFEIPEQHIPFSLN